MARITLDHLAHSYRPHPAGPQDYALREIDHVWRQGGAYALLGPSGCGKTTLLNIISGLVVPTRGRIRFDDRDVTALPTEARNIAQVFQFPVVYDTMTVRENLAFPLRNRRVPAATIRARVEEIARLLDLGRLLDRRAQNLTPDLKQKISLGRGLVRPDVAAILFDEPLTVIDPHLKWRLRSTLKELHRKLDLTMIYVTHDQTEALTFADTVVVMHDGAVVQTGTPEELFDRPAHTFVGHFIGSPGMNLLPARVEGRTALVEGHAIPLARAYPPLPGGRIELGVRPEFAALTARGPGLPVRVRRVDDLGRLRLARVELAGRPLVATLREGESLDGDEAALSLDPRRIHIYADGALVPGEAA
ncbi:ABC transporter related [Methylobacterium sp. 4-46]|uniref:ABC transporter ATP-binding protein n=1 Tax=unclassified Methylobacterium TaxID=2615210 RepID=UPI000152E7B4|nr:MULTISPECIES: ABC transporter ATP-binding protein [Methylobacterium]ACA16438.1 ABC transporter related [Methylobacterium sp. 4-46]WFT82149.1 ABC transporter ATP-binding protein [Methylobacterium nodulans]